MSFRYFTYGSNMWPPQLHSRCGSASLVGQASLHGWERRYDKPSFDTTAKLNIAPVQRSTVEGVLFELDDEDRGTLDAAEPGYDAVTVGVVIGSGENVDALTYQWTGEPTSAPPYDWYVAIVTAGAAAHGVDLNSLQVESIPDPLAPGIRPVTLDDLDLIRSILSEALTDRSGRFSVHPGDIYWWLFHPDPRFPDHVSFWLQGNSAVMTIDSRGGELTVFARPGWPVTGLIEWAQRRLAGKGDVGFVGSGDVELEAYLLEGGYEPVDTDTEFRWHVGRMHIPEPDLPEGWVLRHVEGEQEAHNRRHAAHLAFESKMDESLHLERYLSFMRSPVYSAERDLVAVSPDGRIAAFLVWWPDDSGIAQIEPFGTHPEFQRQGVGRGLMYFALRRMADEGMKVVRVVTNDWREDATGFYAGVGFETVGSIRWWAPLKAL